MAEPVVDYQAHWYPRSFVESLVDDDRYRRVEVRGDGFHFAQEEYAAPLSPGYVDLDIHLADMDANGIDVAVISANLLGEVSRLPVDEAVRTTERVNALVGEGQRDHPDRVVGLGMLPLQDADAALQVLESAAGEHGLQGICVLSNIAGRPIVNPELMKVYRRIDELGLPLFLHPSLQSVAAAGVLEGPTIEIGLAWMFDTAAAALALIYGGVLDACPGLVVVHPHLGGALPYVIGRVAECEWGVDTRHPLTTYLRERFYVDCVQKTPAALGVAIETYGPDRVLYGTDYPWVERPSTRAYVEENLDAGQLSQVLRTNALPNLAIPGR